MEQVQSRDVHMTKLQVGHNYKTLGRSMPYLGPRARLARDQGSEVGVG